MIWIIIGSILLVLICVILGIEYYAYKKVFYSPYKGQNSEYNIVHMKGLEEVGARGTQLVNELLKIPAEDLYTTSFDNLKLHAYLYKSEGSNEFVICFHGLRRTARRSFAGRTMDLLKAKKNVILVDLRAHGLSKGHSITYGKKEQYDVVTWVNYVKEKFGEDAKITLIGVSMGVAIGIIVAIILWWSDFLSKVSEPVLVVLNSLPKVALRTDNNNLGRCRQRCNYNNGTRNITYCNNNGNFKWVHKYRQRKNKNGTDI